jgi:hypothetical protein
VICCIGYFRRALHFHAVERLSCLLCACGVVCARISSCGSSKDEPVHRLRETNRGKLGQARLQQEDNKHRTPPRSARVLPSCVCLPSRSRARTRSRRPVDRAAQFACLPLSSSRRPSLSRRASLRRPPLPTALASRLADLQEQPALRHVCIHVDCGAVTAEPVSEEEKPVGARRSHCARARRRRHRHLGRQRRHVRAARGTGHARVLV